MGSYSYYVKAINEDGTKTILKLTLHHGDLEDTRTVTKEEMKNEIKENKEYYA